MTKQKLQDYVEEKIFKNYMVIGNININEFKIIDDFCKEHYDDNRKRMLLDLIKDRQENISTILLDDKITLIYDTLLTRIEYLEKTLNILHEDKIEPKQEIKKPTWKGFSKKE